MTEAENQHYDLITKDFNGEEIEFIQKSEDVWLTAETIGNGLDYKNHRKDIMQLYYRHQDEIEEFKGILNLSTPGGMQKTTIFNEMGIYLLIMFSNQPKAKDFRKWVASVIKEIRKTGSYIEKAQDPYDIFVKQAEMIKNAFIGLKKQNEKLNLLENHVQSVDTELKSFEQKYEEERIITPQTKRIITDTVQYANKCTGRHWGTIYKIIWNSFKIRSITGISEILGLKIISWMEIHPFFKKYINQGEK